MKPRTLRIKQYAAALVAATALGAAIGLAERALSADASPIAERRGGEMPEPKYMGSESCKLCHSKPDNASPGALATLDEFTTWDGHDKHRAAFDALSCPRAVQMERLLGWKPGEAAMNRQCLACHAIDVTKDSAGDTLHDEASRHEAVAKGVSCEACHGAASNWIDPHWKIGGWRKLTPDDKSAKKYGLTNLHDPVRRTELCLSCHLGDIAAGKFVTHDMFAAGHPPLPAFEVETFLEQMPPHWRKMPPHSRTRSVAVEGLVALRASIQMLLPPPEAHDAAGPADFAIYDCTACHHELQRPSPRQERGYFGGTPGRPALRFWDTPLATAALALQAAQGDKIAPSPIYAAMARLQTAAGTRPFGDEQAVRTAAREAIDQLNKAISDLPNAPTDRKESRNLIERLCRAGAEAPLDYELAWQLTGALRAVASDWEHVNAGELHAPVESKMKASIEELSRLVDFPAAPDPAADRPTPCHGTLWSNGTDFNPEGFRKKLEEIVAGFRDR